MRHFRPDIRRGASILSFVDALQHAANGGWAPWTTTMKKLGMNEWSGIGGHALAGRSPSRTQPSNMAGAASIPTLPVTSQPMVSGG